MKPSTYISFSYKNKKYPLFNSEDYKIDIPNNTSIPIPPWEERLLLCYLNNSETIEDAKRIINQYLNCEYNDFPLHLREHFINKFINSHPSENVDCIDNPTYSINGFYSFHVPSLDNTITISEEEEKELIEIVNTHKKDTQRKVSQWFLNYYYQKGVNPFSMIEEVKEIADSFIVERGVLVYKKTNIEGVLTGVAVIWKVLISIVAAIILIGLIFSALRVVFS